MVPYHQPAMVAEMPYKSPSFVGKYTIHGAYGVDISTTTSAIGAPTVPPVPSRLAKHWPSRWGSLGSASQVRLQLESVVRLSVQPTKIGVLTNKNGDLTKQREREREIYIYIFQDVRSS